MNHTMPRHIKAGTVNARRNAADKRLAAEFAQRRAELQAKLDAIVAANKPAPDGALQQTIDYGAELEDYQDYLEDVDFWRSGQW